jgi:hypothetical protein
MIYRVSFQMTSLTFEISQWKLKTSEWDAKEIQRTSSQFPNGVGSTAEFCHPFLKECGNLITDIRQLTS